MGSSKKFVDIIKDSVNTIKNMISHPNKRPESESESLRWSDANNTVVIKQSEYEKLHHEITEQSNTIKRLKYKEDEYRSTIQDYENTFTMVLQRDFGRSLQQNGDTAKRKCTDEYSRNIGGNGHGYESCNRDQDKLEQETGRRDTTTAKRTTDEITSLVSLRANEERLKSHIQALKRELFVTEEKQEKSQEEWEKKEETYKMKIGELLKAIDREKEEKIGCIYENKEMKFFVEKKNKEIAELIEICRCLLNG